MQDLQCRHHLGFLRQVPGMATRGGRSRVQTKKKRQNQQDQKAREWSVVLEAAPVTQDVHAHHRNPEVDEQKHGVKPGAFAAVQSRCRGHQQICHKMHCVEATH